MSYERCSLCGGLAEQHFPGTHRCPITLARIDPPSYDPRDIEIAALRTKVAVYEAAIGRVRARLAYWRGSPGLDKSVYASFEAALQGETP